MSRQPGVDTDTLPFPDREAGAGAAGGQVELHGLRFDVAGFSEQGPRKENQDAYLVESFAASGLVAVADGMGGERGGRLAAETALRALLDAGSIGSLDDARRAVRAADRAVASAAQQNAAERQGMGCALGLLALRATRGEGPAWVGAHVGDVRILSRSPDGTVRLETRDHTPAFARWEAGEIDLDAIPEAEGANRLQRAVGRGGEADAIWLPARPGWVYTIVSDGVTKAMRLDELGRALATPSAAAACETIHRKVEERGPDDNFTAVVVRILDTGAAPTAGAAPPNVSHATGSTPVTPPPPRRSVASVVTGVLTVLALLASGAAFWMAREAHETASDRTEFEQLRQEVDSLRLHLQQLEEPFGPEASSAPQGTPGTAPATPTGPGAPRPAAPTGGTPAPRRAP
jgi:serine/threonine protein phosphatase PrpC